MMHEWSLAFVWSHPNRDAFPGALGSAIDPLAAASLVLAFVGLAAGLARPATRGGTLLVGSVLVVCLVGLAPFLIHDRLVVSYAPLFQALFAHGLAAALRAVAQRFARDERAAGGAGLVVVLSFGALSVAGILRASGLPYGLDPPVEREAGLWLATATPRVSG